MTANYENIVDVAKHCDTYKLRIAETNAMDYDMQNVLCEFENYIEGKLPEDEIYVGGKIGIFNFGGLNKIYGLFSYARYVENSIYVDTGSGFVRKDHGNSFPVQMAEVKDIAQQHRVMALTEIERLRAYICNENGTDCICGGKYCDAKKRNTTLTARKSYEVRKRMFRG